MDGWMVGNRIHSRTVLFNEISVFQTGTSRAENLKLKMPSKHCPCSALPHPFDGTHVCMAYYSMEEFSWRKSDWKHSIICSKFSCLFYVSGLREQKFWVAQLKRSRTLIGWWRRQRRYVNESSHPTKKVNSQRKYCLKSILLSQHTIVCKIVNICSMYINIYK